MPTLADRFRGCLFGAAIGDMIGAVVEAESPGYIASTFRSVDDLLAAGHVAEFTGPDWQVGRFTDDTQMMLCVAEWLVTDASHSPEALLAQFAAAYEPWRRCGPSTAEILWLFEAHRSYWRELATASFPYGSFGNGSAMRVAPVGLVYQSDLSKLADVAIASSRPTHTRPSAYQAAVLQATAAATAVTATASTVADFVRPLREQLSRFSENLQDTSQLESSLDEIERGLRQGNAVADMAGTLGTGVPAVPPAVIRTRSPMAGAISGAHLGSAAIPPRRLAAASDPTYTTGEIEKLSRRLLDTCARG